MHRSLRKTFALGALAGATLLAGCGLGESATSAAVAAKAKADELERAKAMQQQMVGDIQKANEQAEQRLKDAESR